MISIEETKFVNMEQQLLSLEVYLEKSDKPKIFKAGRSAGMLVVTNLRIFFFVCPVRKVFVDGGSKEGANRSSIFWIRKNTCGRISKCSCI